jgi:hypothetical protein
LGDAHLSVIGTGRACPQVHPERVAAPRSRVVHPQRRGAWEKHRKAADEARVMGAGAHLLLTDLLQRILYLSGRVAEVN